MSEVHAGPALSKADAAAYLGGLSLATLMRRVAAGEITATVLGGRTVFLQSDLDIYLARHRQPPKPTGRRRTRRASREAVA